MTEEISRRYINGEWVTSARPEGSGPGGGVSEIVADDASIVVTNGTGPTVGLSAPGGSVPESLLAFASVNVSAAEIRALKATPKELLPAPGGRFYYVLHRAALHYRFGTEPFVDDQAIAAYTFLGMGAYGDHDYLQLLLSDGPTVAFATWPVQTEDTYVWFNPADPDSAGTWLASEIENKPILLGIDPSGAGEGEITGGDGSLTIRLWYSLIDGAPA